MAKHSVAPWKREGGLVVLDRKTRSLRYAILTDCETLPREQTYANLNLAAAAPELLEALKLVAKEWPHEAPAHCYSTGPNTGDLVQDYVACPGCAVQKAVESAILKAEGK